MQQHTGGGTCPECGTPLAYAGQLLCQGCYVPFALMTAGPVRAAPPGSAPDDTEPVPSAAPEAERAAGALLAAGGLPRPAQAHADASAGVLRLGFPDGRTVSVKPGERIRLGRDPLTCPAVPFLAVREGLSRLHAVVGVDLDGLIWIVDEGSTNGTFVHGYRVVPKERTTLRPGDTFRLAADVTVRVLI